MTYAIVITGEINPGFTQEQVINNLAALFKKETSFVENFFCGKPVVIRRDLDMLNAQKYQAAISKAGCGTKIVEEGAASQQSTDTVKVDKTTSSPNDFTMAEAGETIVHYEMPEEPSIDISSLSMSSAGEQIINPVEVPKVNIDTSNIDLSPSGSVLTEKTIIEDPNIDISNLSMSQVGSEILDTDK